MAGRNRSGHDQREGSVVHRRDGETDPRRDRAPEPGTPWRRLGKRTRRRGRRPGLAAVPAAFRRPTGPPGLTVGVDTKRKWALPAGRQRGLVGGLEAFGDGRAFVLPKEPELGGAKLVHEGVPPFRPALFEQPGADRQPVRHGGGGAAPGGPDHTPPKD